MQANDERSNEHRDENIETLSNSDFSDDDCVEVIAASADLFTVLGIDVVQL